MPNLQCSTSKHRDLIVVAATGDADLATSEKLWCELSSQLVSGAAVALDCTGITFMDSMGLQALMRTRQRAVEQEASFALIGSNQYVDRVMELAGLSGMIPRFADVETAWAD